MLYRIKVPHNLFAHRIWFYVINITTSDVLYKYLKYWSIVYIGSLEQRHSEDWTYLPISHFIKLSVSQHWPGPVQLVLQSEPGKKTWYP